MQITAHGDSHIGRIRQTNEDHYLSEQIRDQEHLFIIADGMGGHQAGDVASRLGTQSFTAHFKRLRKQGTAIADAMLQSLRQANLTILSKAQEDPHKKGMGTTFSAAVVDNDRLHIIHVGDSRIYLVRDGVIRRLTTDQTFVAKMVEDGRITEEEARDHPQKNILYMSLGARDEFTPELISDFPLQEKDILVLCSDGLNTHVTDDVIRAYAESYYPGDAVRGLIRRANEGGGMDNITVLVVRLGPLVDLENTVVLPASEQQRRFPYFWFGIGLCVLLLLLWALFFHSSGGRAGIPVSGERAHEIQGLNAVDHSSRLELEPIDLSMDTVDLLRADPRRLVFFADERAWLRVGNGFQLLDLGNPHQVNAVTLPSGDELIPSPAGQRVVLRQDPSAAGGYAVYSGNSEIPVLRLRAHDSQDGIDPSTRTVFISGLSLPLKPVLITEDVFVFADAGRFFLVENPLLPAVPPRLRKCSIGEGVTPLVHSIKLEGRDVLLPLFVKLDGQLRVCRFSFGKEPETRVIPIFSFRLPLGAEAVSAQRYLAYSADKATLYDLNGESRTVGLPQESVFMRIAHIVLSPLKADRLAVTTDGRLFRVGVK